MEETGILENPNLSSVCYLVLNQVPFVVISVFRDRFDAEPAFHLQEQ